MDDYKKKWNAENPEKVGKDNALWRQYNKDKSREQIAKWRLKNADRQKILVAAWAKNNPQLRASAEGRRRARKLQATPAWANDFFISEAYDLAARRSKATGIKWHVDHIVPLRSKMVCGLHCEANLRVISGRENIIKGNRFWPDMP